MRLLGIAIILALVSASASAQNPVRHGRALLRANCGACHAVGSKGPSTHRAAPPLRRLGRSFDLDDLPRLLSRGISAGHPDMPEVRFNEDDARDVRAYLRSIQE
ncbi:MAG TPA: cytochrome c [Pseudolabrys sp.]|jgi:mono/diheme cytochrome c family protein|nr:cytochrome c [Pseudolabrys sp.]